MSEDHPGPGDRDPEEDDSAAPAAAPKAAPAPAAEPEVGVAPADAQSPFEARARLAEDRLTEVLTAYRQLKADTETHRERTTRNIQRRFEQRHEKLLLRFIDILDNLDRALEAAQTTHAGETMVEGLILVRTQLLQTLKEEGLERIPVIGQPYDPHVSEAVATAPVDDPEQHHIVVKELIRGYKLNGHVARASQVVLGEYREGARPAEAVVGSAGAASQGAVAAAGSEPEPTLEEILTRLEGQDDPRQRKAAPKSAEAGASAEKPASDPDEPQSR